MINHSFNEEIIPDIESEAPLVPLLLLVVLLHSLSDHSGFVITFHSKMSWLVAAGIFQHACSHPPLYSTGLHQSELQKMMC